MAGMLVTGSFTFTATDRTILVRKNGRKGVSRITMATYENMDADERSGYEIENPLSAAANASDVQVSDVDVEQKQVETKAEGGKSSFSC